jgi:hypothetical protein
VAVGIRQVPRGLMEPYFGGLEMFSLFYQCLLIFDRSSDDQQRVTRRYLSSISSSKRRRFHRCYIPSSIDGKSTTKVLNLMPSGERG